MQARIEEAFRGIFERRYFANDGPLVRELDGRLSEYLDAHAVCVTNESVAFMILAKALELRGEIIVPAGTPPATLSALRLAGVSPVPCRVDRTTGMMDADAARREVTPLTSALMAAFAWGRAGDASSWQSVAQSAKVPFLFDATQAMGCAMGDAAGSPAVFSFHQSTALGAGEGGCIATPKDDLARKLRTMRNFAASRTFADAPLRLNGKMSEAQAALALIALDDLPETIAANRRRYDAYARGLHAILGVRMLAADERSNFQYIIADVEKDAIGISAEELTAGLAASGIAAERVTPGVLFPNGPRMTEREIDRICGTVRQLHDRARGGR